MILLLVALFTTIAGLIIIAAYTDSRAYDYDVVIYDNSYKSLLDQLL